MKTIWFVRVSYETDFLADNPEETLAAREGP